MMIHRNGRAGLLCAALIAAVVGCGKADPASRLAELNQNNLQRVGNLYLAYQMQHDFQGPKDQETFVEFIRGLSTKKLQRIGVGPDDIDSLFISERDGQPFEIRYRVKGNVMGCQEPVVFEAEGESGMRRVGFLDMTQREVDESEYEQLMSKGNGSNADQRT